MGCSCGKAPQEDYTQVHEEKEKKEEVKKEHKKLYGAQNSKEEKAFVRTVCGFRVNGKYQANSLDKLTTDNTLLREDFGDRIEGLREFLSNMEKGEPVRANEELVQLVQDAVKDDPSPGLEDIFRSKFPEHESVQVFTFQISGVTNEKDNAILAAILLNAEFDFTAVTEDQFVPVLDPKFENIGMTIRVQDDGSKSYIGIITENIDKAQPEVEAEGE